MGQGKEKEPCGNMALIVTKNDFYYTVIRCIGIFMTYQYSSLTLSDEAFWLAWLVIAFLVLSITWDCIKSM